MKISSRAKEKKREEKRNKEKEDKKKGRNMNCCIKVK